MFTWTYNTQTANKNVYSKVTNGLWIKLCFNVIFNNMEIKMREPLEIATKFDTKTLCTFFFSPQKSSKTLQKPKYIKTPNVKPYNYQNYVSCLVLVLLSGHLRECQNWNFWTILCPRIQHRYKTSRTRNLVDCSVLYVLGGIFERALI